MRPLASNAIEKLYRAAASAGFGAAWAAMRLAGSPTSDLRSRSGHVPKAAGQVLWFHGASAGEMAAAVRLSELLRAHGFSFTAAYTATNAAGVQLATARQRAGDVATLAPWDVRSWLSRSFDIWRPKALFLVETELWPSLVAEAAYRKVPAFFVSARIYSRDLWRYTMIRPLIRPMLQRVAAILAADESERQRFIDLGASADRCFVAGNLKYLSSTRSPGPTPLDRILCTVPRERMVVCGSIHTDEVPDVFVALDALPRDVQIVIAPRHMDAAPCIVEEARRRNWTTHLSSAGTARESWRVLLLDSVGELSRAYGFGCVALVGGGFRRHGGHNPFEPVVEGAPVLFGSHFDHFANEAAALTAACPEALTTGPAELAERLRGWVEDPLQRRRVLSLQEGAVPNARQIAESYTAQLNPWLHQQGIAHVSVSSR